MLGYSDVVKECGIEFPDKIATRYGRKHMANVIVNLTNIHDGGALQVATSFLDELSRTDAPSKHSYEFLVSAQVWESVQALGSDIRAWGAIEVMDTFGFGAMRSGLLPRLNMADLVFTLFGPLYLFGLKPKSIAGFAQAWIIYPETDACNLLSLYSRVKTKILYSIKEYFFNLSDYFIVELDHVKDGLIKRRIATSDQVFIAYNAPNGIFFSEDRWEPFFLQRREVFSLGIITRDHVHKNLNILPVVKQLLLSRYGIEVDFYVTFNDAEWAAKSADFQSSVTNLGPLKGPQCPNFYKQLDGVIFPSLLECFSATVVEALIMKKPLFASDRTFVRDIAKDAAYYFDPNSPESIAETISEYIANKSGHDRLAERGYRYVQERFLPRQRALDYIAIIDTVAARHNL